MRVTYLALAAAAMLTAVGAEAEPAPAASAAPAATPVGPVTSARVIMLRLYVADLARGEKFYHEVFGTSVMEKLGDNVMILNFPGGALPGIIMIKSADEARMNGSFVMQVPDVQATLARAAANGGILMNTRFAQQVEGMPARSSHFTDPDGNIVEVLQIGGPPKR